MSTMQATTSFIESKFIFNHKDIQVNFIKDEEGHQLGFHFSPNGNKFVFTKDVEGIDVAIEHCADGTKIFHMEKDSKGLPAMHEFRPDGTELIYLFDANKTLEKMVHMHINGDKTTYWFSPSGEVITQEQRQQGGILFKMSTGLNAALIWLHADGQVTVHGEGSLITHLQSVFSKFLDGAEITV